mgnify:CR=1 FL=1
MKILLACNAGMSTSLLVQKMRKEAAARSLDADIEAGPLAKALTKAQDADVLLLGPQISYAKQDALDAVDGKTPVVVIPMATYGRMDAKKVIDMALDATKE